MRRVFPLLFATILSAATPLERRIDDVLASFPAGRSAFSGIHIASLATGEVLYRKDDERLFLPASNVKLFSTALALERLGAGYRFETSILAERPPDKTGCIRGDLRLVGGGDPTLSGRPIPYRKNGPVENPLRAIEELANEVAARGVRRIEGDVIGDDTAFLSEPYSEGWSQDDTLWEHGAPVSALTVNDNIQTFSVRPGERAGDPARLFLSPPLEYFAVDNRVETVASRETGINFRRTPGSRQLRLSGTVRLRSQGAAYRVAVDDPALFAAAALIDALNRRGIAVSGTARACHRYEGDRPARPAGAPAFELVRRTSPPLAECLRIVNKVSQNLHAELILRAVGRARGREGSLDAGLDELRNFLSEAGISTGEYSFTDASGLSRLNLVTPAALVRLLRHMHASAHRDEWLALFPVGGEDGTLSSRFQGLREASVIRAKTGSLEHTGALSGYARVSSGDPVVFAVLVNNDSEPSSGIRQLIDRIVAVILE